MGYLKAVGKFAWHVLGKPEVRDAVLGFLEREVARRLAGRKSA